MKDVELHDDVRGLPDRLDQMTEIEAELVLGVLRELMACSCKLSSSRKTGG
jgi:hypothetical protein